MTQSKKNGSGCALLGAGCGITLLVAILFLGVAGFFGYKLVKGSYDGIKKFADIALIENEVVNQTRFTPPEDGLMSLEQVESLVYIQTRIKESLGPDFEEILQTQKTLVGELEQMSDFAKVRKLISVSGKLVKPLSEAKRVQIEAINREGLSMSEYRWMQRQALASLGISSQRLDIGELIESMQGEGEVTESEPVEPVTVHPQNRRMLEPHAQVLSETLLFSAIGI
ncbi:MAG: hypothetical protein ABQ298_15760 [Puniceicoccaceae bacterium]